MKFSLEKLDNTVRRPWSDWKNLLIEVYDMHVIKDMTGIAPDRIMSLTECLVPLGDCTIDIAAVPEDEEVEFVESIVERKPWSEWLAGKELESDESGFSDADMLSADEAEEALKLCTFKSLSVTEWAERYQALVDSIPEPGTIVGTIDGSRIKISIELDAGAAPFMFTRLFVPKIVGSKLGWFAQSEKDSFAFGWRAILIPKCRDEAMHRCGLRMEKGQPQPILVKSIEVLRMAASGHSILIKVKEW